MTRSTGYNSTFAIGGVSCSAESIEVKGSSVLRINICSEKPARTQSCKTLLSATFGRQCNLQLLCKKRAVQKVRQAVFAILRKSKREAKPTHKPTQFVSHLLLPNRKKTYLRNMKRTLLTFVFLLTGICYLLQTLELDSNECKQNYEKETHSFIDSVRTTTDFSFHSDKAIDLPFTFSDFIFRCDFHSQPLQFSFLNEPSPPDKIYFRQQSLLI